ncbi:Major facilitator superfamily like protein, partial [Aduncisulcus paluster]
GTLIYIFIRETLKMGDKSEMAWGILLSAIGFGSVIGSFIIGVKVKNYPNPFKLFLNVLILDSIALGIFVFNTYFPLSIGLFVVLGCIGAAHMIILNTVLQKTIPDENRGKVFSVLEMINGPAGVLSILLGTAAATVIT